jgi:hypothetical protein
LAATAGQLTPGQDWEVVVDTSILKLFFGFPHRDLLTFLNVSLVAVFRPT